MAGAIVLLLAAVFGLAGVSKIRSREKFVAVLRNLVSPSLARMASVLMPGVELSMAAFLLSGIAPQKAVAAAIFLLVAFTILLLEMRRRGVKGCACFGESSDTANIVSGVVRNLFLIAAAAGVLYQSGPMSFIGPDVSSFLGRVTIVIGVFCLWPCLVALASICKQLSNQSKT